MNLNLDTRTVMNLIPDDNFELTERVVRKGEAQSTITLKGTETGTKFTFKVDTEELTNIMFDGITSIVVPRKPRPKKKTKQENNSPDDTEGD